MIADLLFSILAVGAPSADAPLRCDYDKNGSAYHSTTDVIPYPVDGRTVDEVNEQLAGGSKPFSFTDNSEIGWFSYSWRSRIGTRADEVYAVCINVHYTIYYPEFVDPKMKRCFRRVGEHVLDHENRHKAISEKALRKAGRRVLGRSKASAQSRLDQLDSEIDEAQDAFHRTRSGGPVRRKDFPESSCGQ